MLSYSNVPIAPISCRTPTQKMIALPLALHVELNLKLRNPELKNTVSSCSHLLFKIQVWDEVSNIFYTESKMK